MSTEKAREVLKRVLKKIKPTLEQKKKLNEISKLILTETKKEAARFRGNAIIAGSLTRNTWLPSKNEFDIFIIFPKEISEEGLEKYGLEIGKKVMEKVGGSWIIEYAQHPYVRGTVGNIEIDIVPCFDAESGEKIRSPVDRTPLHVKYLDEKFPKGLADEVRLLKAFLKANKIYGADAKTEGFSGYICELLITQYGTFMNLLKNVLEWQPGEIIDIENHWAGKDRKKIRKDYKDEILIIIDPVDKNRNAAAAISAESFYKFKKIAKEFLKSPSEEIFKPKAVLPLTKKEFELHLQNRGTDFIAITFNKPDVVPDILWPQLRRATKRLEAIMQTYEFRVHRSECWSNEKDLCAIVLEMEISKLPLIDEKVGPYVWKEENSRNFIKKYKDVAINGPYIRDNQWRVEIKRVWKTASGKLRDSLSDKEEILKEKGLPNYVASEIVQGFNIFENEKVLQLIENKEFAIFLREYFEKEKLDVE